MNPWQWYCPTRIFFARGAVRDNSREMALGQKALIVTGQGGSAKRNGALGDVCSALAEHGVAFCIYDRVESNPAVSDMREGAGLARKEQVDFIVGVGGGSPLDAAKAIAVLAVNDINDEDLFAGRFAKALPVAAVPTTARTGSEATPYSILTYPDINSKKSIYSPLIFPAAAFLDSAYTRSLPDQTTIDTALDAFAHAFESYLTIRTNPLSDALARKVLFITGRYLHKMGQECWSLDENDRDQLLYASLLAGMAISQTGTSIPHALGYSYTYFKGVPHGRANGYVLPPFARFLARHKQPRLWQALESGGFDSLDKFALLIEALSGPAPVLDKYEQDKFIDICSRAKNLNNTIVRPTLTDLRQILLEIR